MLGWDAVGEVVATGEVATQFKPVDLVYYAGDINHQGSNAEYQLVDERLVGSKPKSLSDTEAAALPLITITAWEFLFERLSVQQPFPNSTEKSDEVIPVVGAAGDVGSIILQLAKAIPGATIIATASRESSQAWLKKLGAHHVVDHTQPRQPQNEALGIGLLTHNASLNSSDCYFESYTALLAPFGKIAPIDDPVQPLDLMKMKPRSQLLHIEFMFARSMFKVANMNEQSRLLNRVSDLVDLGYIHSTIGKNLGTINADNLKAANQALESGRSIGKIFFQGF